MYTGVQLTSPGPSCHSREGSLNARRATVSRYPGFTHDTGSPSPPSSGRYSEPAYVRKIWVRKKGSPKYGRPRKSQETERSRMALRSGFMSRTQRREAPASSCACPKRRGVRADSSASEKTCFCKFPSVRISAQRAVSPAMPESATRRLAPRAHIPYTGFFRSNCTIC